MISVIIRTKNEERWIKHCIRKVLSQNIDEQIEIVLVDNNSNDNTVEIAKKEYPGIKIVYIDDFKPGLAINIGIRASKGDYIACISAHCIPVDDYWLKNLRDNLNNENVAGVYGRQLPMEQTSSQNKRDLFVTFGLDKRIQRKDNFFHNANSMLPRKIWERFPFDEQVTNIEDRVWAGQVIKENYQIVYEPDAPVYHYHGIHQDGDQKRAKNVVRIIESIEDDQSLNNYSFSPEDMEIIALIPIKTIDNEGLDTNEYLLSQTIEVAKKCKYIKKVYILTDDTTMESKSETWGIEDLIIRPPELSDKSVRVNDVLKWGLEYLNNKKVYPDLIVPLEIVYPFRSVFLLNNLISLILKGGFDTAVAGYSEYNPAWVNKDDRMVRVDYFMQLKKYRDPILISLHSLGCVTYPDVIKNGSRIGKKVGIYQVNDYFEKIKIRSVNDLDLVDKINAMKNK